MMSISEPEDEAWTSPLMMLWMTFFSDMFPSVMGALDRPAPQSRPFSGSRRQPV